jgi:hypothetical protein
MKCSRCHSLLLEEYFKRNRKGILNKCCNTCLDRFKCTLCDYKCSRNSHLQIHIKRVHTRIRDFECNQCPFKCSTNSDLQRHIKQVHDKIRDFECNQCPFKCSTNTHLQMHIKRIHLKIKDFECNQCPYKSSTNCDLQRHIKAVHDLIKDFECLTCEFKSSTNTGLQKHIKMVHDKIKDFDCPTCPYKSSTNGDLHRHIKTCTGKLHCSSGEFEIMKVLDELNVPYVHDENYDGLKDKGYLRWDVRILSDEPIFIEYDGEGHYLPIRWGGVSEEKANECLLTHKRRDKIKDDYCLNEGYLLLRIPYWEKTNIKKIVSEYIYENTC